MERPGKPPRQLAYCQHCNQFHPAQTVRNHMKNFNLPSDEPMDLEIDRPSWSSEDSDNLDFVDPMDLQARPEHIGNSHSESDTAEASVSEVETSNEEFHDEMHSEESAEELGYEINFFFSVTNAICECVISAAMPSKPKHPDLVIDMLSSANAIFSTGFTS